MNRVALGSLGMIAAALVAVISVELQGLRSGDQNLRPSGQREAPLAPGGRTALVTDRSQDWLSTILSRPLFSATRRPPPGTATSGAGVGVPRLSGVLVSQSGKRAIFAAPPGGKALVAGEGARIGEFVLQSISAGQVTLMGAGGTHVLRPTFDTAASAASKAASAAFAPIPTPPAALTVPMAGADQQPLFGMVRTGPPPAVGTAP